MIVKTKKAAILNGEECKALDTLLWFFINNVDTKTKQAHFEDAQVEILEQMYSDL